MSVKSDNPARPGEGSSRKMTSCSAPFSARQARMRPLQHATDSGGYSKGTQAKKAAAARTPTTATKAAAPARRHARPPMTTAKAAGGKRSSSNLGDQVLALATGKTQQEIAAACKGARPNHVGAALSRHKRAGLIEERDGKLYAIPSSRMEQRAAL
jgi:hypothetical protein